MSRLIDDFKRSNRANNEKFRRDMADHNQAFREKIRDSSAKTNDTKTAATRISVKAAPVKALRKPKSHTKRIIITIVACLVVVTTLAVIFAPPTLAVTSSLNPLNNDSYTLTGKVDHGDTVLVNNNPARVTDSTFTATLNLVEGDNNISIVVQSGKKKTEKHVTLHRYTTAEVTEQKRLAAEKKTHQEALKKAADEALQARVAEQQRQVQAAAAAEQQKQQELVAQQQAAAAAAQQAQQRAAVAASAPSSSGSGYVNVNGNYVPSPSSNPVGATAKCRDGTYSYSQNHSGTCSSHGGVLAWL
jgi:hypothetical protein